MNGDPMADNNTVTATAALRDLLAETEATRRHGVSLDGYRSPATRDECYAVADAMLPLFTADWSYGVRRNPTSVRECDDLEHARKWKWIREEAVPVVRQLGARLAGQAWQPVPEEASHG